MPIDKRPYELAMPTIIEQIRAKVARAKQHIQDLQLALNAFYKTKPYGIGIKEDAQSGKRIYYASKVEPVPAQVTTIAADVLQNLRAPLDYIAYQLVMADCGLADPEQPVYYPICKTAADYPSARAKIQCIRQVAMDAIDATEPYQGGKGHALWQLNMLNKADKHRLLIQAAPYAGGVDIVPTARQIMPMLERFNLPPIFIREVGPLKPLQVGDELYIEPIEHKVDEDRKFLIPVAFNKPGVIECEPALKTVQDIANLVEDLVARLEPFFP